MSFNQSRPDKSDSQYRKSGRSTSFNQQRGFSGAHVKGGGGGGPAPTPSVASGSSVSSNRSYKKSNNPQGGQSRVNQPPAHSTESHVASTTRTVQNGSHVQEQLHVGPCDAPDTNATVKSTESSASQRGTRVVPKAPTSQPPPVNSDSAAPVTPSKSPGDVSKAFPFQFGSISPGFMNGMTIPARTSSAPPNLDEQKRAQARHDSFRPVPSVPAPPVPKQQPPRKDAAVVDQSNSGDAHSGTRSKKDPQVPSPASQMPKPSVVSMTGISMAMPFYQSQASIQFGGPNPQMQSQGMSTASLPMPIMPLPIGNSPPVQPQVFVPGLQHHPIHPQGIMHQGQSMSFAPQMGPPLPHQLGNVGINLSTQYPQQQGGKFGGQRKTTVKITHPETHEELRLDKRVDAYSDGGSSGARSHPNVPSQPQPVQSYAAPHPIYYAANSYSTSSLFFPSNSLPLTTSQITPNSQPPRFNYPVNHSPQNVGFLNTSNVGSLPVNKTGTSIPGTVETPNHEHSRDMHNVNSSAPSGVTSVTIKSSSGSGVVDSSLLNVGISGVEKSESPRSSGASGDARSSVAQKGSETCSESSSLQPKSSSDSLASSSSPKQSSLVTAEDCTSPLLQPAPAVVSDGSVSVVSNNEGRKKESLSRSNSLKDNNKKKLGKKGQSQCQVAVQSPAAANVPSLPADSVMSDGGASETTETKTNYSVAINSEIPQTAPVASSSAGGSDPVVEVKIRYSTEGVAHTPAEAPSAQAVDSSNNYKHDNSEETSQRDKHLKQDILDMGDKDQGSSNGLNQNITDGGLYVGSVTSNESQKKEQDAAKVRTEVIPLKTVQQGQDEAKSGITESDWKSDNSGFLSSAAMDVSHDSLNRNDSAVRNESISGNSYSSGQKSSDLSQPTSEQVKDSAENSVSGSVLLPASATVDKPILVKTTSRGKKKRKEILQRADAAGSTSDLYNAYKGPEEKKEVTDSLEKTESASTSGSLNRLPSNSAQLDAIAGEQGGQNKAEPDDWEDAAEMSTPKLEVSDKAQVVNNGNGSATKKYSRDFLMKFAEKCTDLPEGFEIMADIAEALISTNISSSYITERDSHPSPGRTIERQGSMSRLDRRGSGVFEDDRWSKVSSGFGPGRLDTGFGGNTGFRPGQGTNYGVLRNPRAPTPLHYAGGILSGPMQSMGSQGGMQRNSPDGERWQRSSSFQQRGLIPSPSPQTPLQMMHKAEKKYEVGKVTDEEEAKQRQLKAILNKLTPQNFEKLFEQVKAVNIDTAVTLTGVISQIFEKALMEPTFCEMYANFCLHLAAELPDFSEENEKITFKRLLLNKCQEEFERGEREQEEANKADEGEVQQSAEGREEKRVKARRRMLGNIRLIGELYKKKMLTERIMHECIKKLLGQYQDPDEEDIEALCKLMSTIGEMIDHPKAKVYIDAYFERMNLLSTNMKLSSRVRFMLKDAIDLRKNKWQQKRKVEGPKKIEEVHRDAAQERHLAGRAGRGPANNLSARRAPVDFGPRGSSMLPSPSAQMGGLRGMPQIRGYGSQDVRVEERQSYDARTLSVPLPQRPSGDDSITLGPQGGLARGMSIRGPTTILSTPVSDTPPVLGDSRRLTLGLNGYSNLSECGPYGSREDPVPRFTPDRFGGSAGYDHSIAQERNVNYGNRDLRNADRNFDRSVATSPPAQMHGPRVSQDTSSEKVWPEERLHDMSMAAIKEFYSARDEKEVALCVKDLNAPSFHPSMVSLWVTDSFERKDTERDLLAKLFVNLTKSQDGTLSKAQLSKGFESVLATLEDAVNDAPRAAEFLGHIFAKVITENVISLKEIGQLIQEGGDEPASLLQTGLAADVLGNTLEVIKLEKGDAVLTEIQTNSNLRLENFRPPDSIKSKKLEQFIRV